MAESVNILIGVGGTGAKVVEAALVLMAAGIGPHEVHVGLVDQDQSNGNVARTRNLLTSLIAFRQSWQNGDAPNSLNWVASQGDPVTIGSVKVTPLFPDEKNALWCPEGRQGTLSAIIGNNLDAERQQLFDLLFMRGPEEQELPLGKGYRGRAHVGATALVAAIVERDSALIARLRELMESPDKAKVNVFLVGSAFGGTGAAGFPTLARALHRLRTPPAKDAAKQRPAGAHGQESVLANHQNIMLGGLLMLPYFSFNDDRDADEPVVTSDELLPKAQLALDYYNNLFATEQAFDHFYALGWGSLFHLGYHEPGAAEQANPALAPELFAATAALDFFARADAGGAVDKTRVMLSARQDLPIAWNDIPDSQTVRARLSQMLRFAVYWRHIAEPMIDAPRGMFGISKNWVQKLSGGERGTEAVDQINTLNDLLDRVVLWAATVEKTGGSRWGAGPWSLRRFVAEQDSPKEPVTLRRELGEMAVLDGFDELIRQDDGAFAARAGADVHHDLTGGKVAVANSSRGIGRVVATVAKAAGLTRV